MLDRAQYPHISDEGAQCGVGKRSQQRYIPFPLTIHVGYQLLMMNEVERQHASFPTDRSSQLLHNVKVGVGLHF